MNAETIAPPELTEEIVKELLEAGVHFGQPLSKRSPRMDQYVYGIARNGVQIIDLDIAWQQINEAKNLIQKLAGEDKNILFVGTNKNSASKVIDEFAEKFNLNFITSRWLGGTLTNPVTRNRINYLRELEGMEASGIIDSLNAKEKSAVSKKLKKLRKNLGGLKKIKGAIHAMVIIDPMHEENATLEALKRANNMSIIAITDTDCKFDPNIFDTVIPCNASSLSSLRKIMDMLMESLEAGRKEASTKKAAAPAPRRNTGTRSAGPRKPMGPRRPAAKKTEK